MHPFTSNWVVVASSWPGVQIVWRSLTPPSKIRGRGQEPLASSTCARCNYSRSPIRFQSLNLRALVSRA